MDGVGSNFTVEHFVDDANVSKGSPCHDEIVSSSGAIGIEIFLFDSLGFQESGCR